MAVATGTTGTYRLWRRLSGHAPGRWLFSVAAAVRVPYFVTIVPSIVAIEPGYAEVRVPKWFLVLNHLRTVHAIVMCNAAELAMGMAMEATVPPTHRWIPKAMTIRYLAKATTSVRACARLDGFDPGTLGEGTQAGREVVVPIGIYDRAGVEVAHADITTWVTPVR